MEMHCSICKEDIDVQDFSAVIRIAEPVATVGDIIGDGEGGIARYRFNQIVLDQYCWEKVAALLNIYP